MSLGIPVSDFIALCIITARYDLDIFLDDLVVLWEQYEKLSSRRFVSIFSNFTDYILLFSTWLNFISYGDWEQIWEVIHKVPKENSLLSDITIREWIPPMLSYSWVDSNDSDDIAFTLKQAEKDEFCSDLHCRELFMCYASEKNIQEGIRFNKIFRQLLADNENLASEVLINFFVSDSYAQRIREIYTLDI